MRHHNGTQNLVLDAIRAGHGSIAEIMRATALDYWPVANALRRLRDKSLIDRGRRGPGNRITPRPARPALEDHWR